MKKIFFTLIALISFVFFSAPSSAYAHVLKTDGSVGAVLHIDPQDDPIAGQSSGFFFEFKDKNGKFEPQKCDCTFSILENDKEIYSQPLFQNSSDASLTSPSIFYTFPEKNVYQVKVTGVPNPQNAFQPFVLTFDVRVAKENIQSADAAGDKQNIDYKVIFGALVGVGLVIFVLKKTFKGGGDTKLKKN